MHTIRIEDGEGEDVLLGGFSQVLIILLCLLFQQSDLSQQTLPFPTRPTLVILKPLELLYLFLVFLEFLLKKFVPVRERRDFLVLGRVGQFEAFHFRGQLVDFLVGRLCFGSKGTDFLHLVSCFGCNGARWAHLFELVHDQRWATMVCGCGKGTWFRKGGSCRRALM
jgi:hypothetical protein